MDTAPREVLCDVRGQICPSTLLTALRTINQYAAGLRSGELVVTVLTDYRDAVNTIPEAAANMGHEARVTREEGCYRILIGARTAPSASREAP